MSDTYDYEKIMQELFDELDMCELSNEDLLEITDAGAKILVKSIEKQMKWKKGYSQNKLKIISEPSIKGITNIGWNEWYGHILENGSINMQAQPHLRTGFESGYEDAQRAMIDVMSKKINRRKK